MMQITRDKIFVCLVGVPGTGKSTFVKNNLKGYVIVSTDDLLEIEAKKQGKTYNEVFKEHYKQAEKDAKAIFEQAIADGVHIVWDQTNIAKKKRASILAQVPTDYYKIAVHFDVPLDVLTERLTKRAVETGKHIPNDVVDSMLKRFETPTLEEGFDEILLV